MHAVDVAVGPAPIPVGSTVTLAPFARFAAGSVRPGPAVDVGLGAVATSASWSGSRARRGLDVPAVGHGRPRPPVESDAPEDVALAVVAALLDLAGGGGARHRRGGGGAGPAGPRHDDVTDLLDGVLVTTAPCGSTPAWPAT